jgi:hypothetical protein
MRLLTLVGMIFSLPGIASAQGRAPFSDHWLTYDAVSGALGLTADQRASVEPRYAAVNAVLQRATLRHGEIGRSFQGQRPVKQMSDGERESLKARLASANAEFDGIQTELEGALAALRAELSAAQQQRFDAMALPRLVPKKEPTLKAAAARARPPLVSASGKPVVLPTRP